MIANDRIGELLADLDSYFEHEHILMEGNYGLTGLETDEEIEDESDMPALCDMRTVLNFRARIQDLRAELGLLPAG